MTLIKQPMYQKDLAKVINHTTKNKTATWQIRSDNWRFGNDRLFFD